MHTIKLETGADGVAIISIDLPDRQVNVFTPEFAADLGAAVEQVLSDDGVKGAVITSGKSSFVVGADLKEILELFDRGMGAADAAGHFKSSMKVMRRMETGGKPFAAAINGHALGGGLELCMACHHRVSADDPKISLGLPEVTVGLLPGGGGTQRLPRLIGIQKALPLLLDGAPLNPAKALMLGIVDAVVPASLLIETARRWVLENPHAQQPWDVKGYKLPGGAGALAPHANQSFSAGMAGIRSRTQDNYPAPKAILSAVYEGTQLPFDRALQIEAKYFGTLLVSPVARNLIRTMFINKALCDKLQGRPSGIPRRTVRTLGVVGAGMMGAGIAYAAANAGIGVVLVDTTEENADRGISHVSKLVDKNAKRGRYDSEHGTALLARVHATTEYASLAHCDMVIEAAFESRAVKKDVLYQIAQSVKPNTIIASNTSTLPISGLADYVASANDFIGLHFFSPVERMPLVEVIVGVKTSPETLAGALDFIAQLRKTPIVVNDSPGFYTSRIFCAYIDEGMAMVSEGVNPALIENAARMSGMATGPLAVVDEVSLDLQGSVIDQAIEDGLATRFLRAHAKRAVRVMTEIGRFGRKSGGGFYAYPAEGKKHLWEGLEQTFPRAKDQPSLDEVRSRLMYIQALESAHCIEEGIITQAMHADLGSILGLGFPTWTGGTISFIETVGLPKFVEECHQLAKLHGARFAPSAWLIERAGTGQQFYPVASGRKSEVTAQASTVG